MRFAVNVLCFVGLVLYMTLVDVHLSTILIAIGLGVLTIDSASQLLLGHFKAASSSDPENPPSNETQGTR